MLTSDCVSDCNSQKKFEVTVDKKNGLASPQTLDQMESENRMEYGYGSGYINGPVKKEKICFFFVTNLRKPCFIFGDNYCFCYNVHVPSLGQTQSYICPLTNI